MHPRIRLDYVTELSRLQGVCCVLRKERVKCRAKQEGVQVLSADTVDEEGFCGG